MKARLCLLVLVALAVPPTHALVTPKASDGPIRLLSCTVSGTGMLEAQVDNQGDEAMFCNLDCTYELGGKMFTHTFSETIRKRFQGRIGQFDTNGARAGNYPGEVGDCRKVSQSGS
jgi:hypothetical protein